MPPQSEEAFANFVGIQACCRNCNASFISKLKLHKHLRLDCLVRPQKPSADYPDPALQIAARQIAKSNLIYQARQAAKSPVKPLCQDAFSLEIVDSDVTDQNLGIGFAFRG